MPVVGLGLVEFASAEQAAEAVWLGALQLLERALTDAREGQHGRWHSYPRGDLRRLRRDVARALYLARLACHMREELDGLDDLERALREEAKLAAVARRRQPRHRVSEDARAGQRARDEAIAENRRLRGFTDGAPAASVS